MNLCRRRLRDCLGGSLHCIGKHYQPRLFVFRLRARVPEILFVYLVRICFCFLCLLVKIAYQRCAVVLLDDFSYLVSKPVLPCAFNALPYMRYQYLGAYIRRKTVMPVLAPHVFYKIQRVFRLADVMVVGADLCEEGVCVYRLCSQFHHTPYYHRMVVCAWRMHGKLLQQRMVHPCQLKMPYVGGISK